MSTRTTLTAVTAITAGIALALAAPLTATAHVSITPNTADPGASENFTFKAVNESETAVTTAVTVSLPTGTPIVSVRYLPTPGWSTSVVESTLPEPVSVGGNEITEAPTSIVFTAEAGSEIQPGQFMQWTVSLGPIPETGSLLLPAVQSYSDGTSVDWVSTAEEVEADASLKSAPVLYVQDEPAEDHHAGSAATDPADADAAAATTEAPGVEASVALGLSIAALLLGVVGAALGAIALFGRKRARG
ncbi:YcnI family protein [Rathayibacter sp. VKM Ac-2929]|uniref:YcnI family copper-binding membrane protein n=1 Tax=unclassified Rathayibacter TaxID=2609250 RepID=UPI0015E49287|nr:MULTISPECIES: YcnI family protein [unclassified Rathayibacter]MCJ1675716.1 YcnI family protein [Rathayibacter sp. VKM Ac-2929]